MRPRSPLRASLSRQRRALAAHLPEALGGDSHAIHQARVASRRLRETLPVVGADLDREDVRKARQRMRRLTRLLGPIRELDVAIGMTEAHGEGDHAEDTRSGRERLQAVLRRDVERARERMTQKLDKDKVARWLEQVQSLEAALADAADARQDGWRDELADRLERRAAALLAALDEAGLLFVAERLHDVRIALKRLRYAMELAGSVRVASTTAAVGGLKAVQDVLGALHDLDVLMGYAAQAAEQPDLDRETRASLLALHGALDTERHLLHAQFLARRPALLRLHDRALEVAARAKTSRGPRAKARAPRRKTPALIRK